MDEKAGYDPEKGIDRVKSRSVDETGRMHSLTGRKSSVAESIIAADLLDERYATTQRGLKSRHAQMIALGGTIGTGYVTKPPPRAVSIQQDIAMF
jgi:amino acid transporter